MSSFTAKYAIPLLQQSDPVAMSPTIMAALANRVDLLLGESGQLTFAAAASTTGSVPITLGRTYPGNTGALVPGIVLCSLVATLSQPNTWQYWINTWTGSASTITGFTFNAQFTNVQAARIINWRYIPCV